MSNEQPPRELLVKIAEGGRPPKKSNCFAAGYDLYSPTAVEIAPGKTVPIQTKIHLKLPINTYGQIASRSGLAKNHQIFTTGGVIDEDYTGDITVLLNNFGSATYNVSVGDKIAQLIILPVVSTTPVLVDSLPDTDRNSQGFGSSGR